VLDIIGAVAFDLAAFPRQALPPVREEGDTTVVSTSRARGHAALVHAHRAAVPGRQRVSHVA
jgi:hypothetical protein